jgi:sulfonate transport system substrate-binding protein
MSQKARIIVGVVIALAVISGFVTWRAWRQEVKVGAPQTVRFGSFSSAVDYGPYIVAKNKGWFDDALKARGISTEYTQFQSLPPINESFATGRVDVVFEAEPPAIVGKAAGINIKIVGISCSLVQEILVPSKSSVSSIRELKGKKIAVLAGTSSHYGLLKILNEAGLKASDVEIIDMIPPDAKGAFQTGRIDAWAVWPPWIEQEEIAGTGRVLPKGDATIQSIMAVRGDFAKQYPEITRDLVSVLARAKQWLAANPAEAQGIIGKELNVSLDVVKRAWPRHDWNAQLTDAALVDIQAKADFLKANNFIKSPVNVRADLIDLSFSR